ncbi:MAG TPA: calcium-binding protein, partial [Verrucomicrobiales bacterium]|nr:calcium-binding protein [Verrucomicrobiales bacterium]
MGLINVILELKGQKPINWSFVDAAYEMFNVVETVNGMLGQDGDILLGDIAGLGSGAPLIPSSAGLELLDKIQDALPKALADFEEQMKADSIGNPKTNSNSAGGSESGRSGFKWAEYMLDINNWAQIFYGGSATLFTYEMPLLEFSADFNVLLASIPLGSVPAFIDISASGHFSAKVDLAFGYDTFGIQKLLEKGTSDVFDGFYVSDFTLPQFHDDKIVPGTGGEEKPEFSLDVGIGIQGELNILIFGAGVRGSVESLVDIDLQDIGRSVLTKDRAGNVTDVSFESDGKIRVSEMVAMWRFQNGGFGNLMNISGGLDFVADAFVVAGSPFGPISLVDVELFRVNLFEFDRQAPNIVPSLAEQQGSTLFINSGPRAADRLYFDTVDGKENFIISGSDGTVNIEFDNFYLTYTGVTHVVADGGAGNDVLDASRLHDVTVEFDGGSGKDVLLAGSAGGVLRGGDGDDRLTGSKQDDMLYGGAGDDRLTALGGNDLLNGGTGDDNVRGGPGDDTFQMVDDFGDDRFADQGDVGIADFSPMTTGVTAFVGRRGVSFLDADGNEFRPSRGSLTELILGSGEYTVYIRDFPEGTLEIRDTGGNDTYYVVAGREAATFDEGIVNITDEGGTFDDIIIEQTRSGEPLVLDTFQVTNGREILNYDGGIDRLTLRGGTSQFGEDGIVHFGGDVTVTSNGIEALDMKTTGLRVVAKSFDYDREIKAGHFVFDTIQAIDFDHRLNAGNDGYIDVRFYEDNADIELTVDLLVSSGDSWDGAGAGWIRLTAQNGSIINRNNVSTLASGSHLILKAMNEIGNASAPILTQVAELTAVTDISGAGNIHVIEVDDLILTSQGDHPVPRNPGLLITDESLLPEWRNGITWDGTISAAWLAEVADGNDLHAVSSGVGTIDITLTGADSRLRMELGDLVTHAAGKDITLIADDFDFLSGASQVIGTGELILRSVSPVWNVYLGTAAEEASGEDVASDEYANSMDLRTRDLAALADGFSLITIGRSEAGNTMTIGDAYDSDVIKASGEARLVDASFRDHTILLSDHIVVAGDVQSPSDILDIRSRTMTVNAQNLHTPDAEPDSGVTAENLVLQIGEQLHVNGWLRGTNSIAIDVTSTSGSDALVTFPNGPNSVVSDVGSSIETFADSSSISINASGSIRVAGLVEVHGTGSVADLTTTDSFMLLEGGLIVGRDSESLLQITGDIVSINPGSAISAGAEFDISSGTPVPVQTAEGADIVVTSTHEMMIAGSVTSSDRMDLNAGGAILEDIHFGDPVFAIYDKGAFFNEIGKVSPEHYLVGHDKYGILVTGTVTTLAKDTKLQLSSADDVILRGNLNVLGENSDLVLQSDRWVYIEGFLKVQDDIDVLGGMSLDAADLSGSDRKGTSVYVHATSRINSLQPGSRISIAGSQDVDVFGAVVASGIIGEQGVTSTGPDGEIVVTAGQQVRVDTGLIASKSLVVIGGDVQDSFALVDLTDEEVTDLSVFNLLVDLVPVGPINVSAVQTGSELTDLLNENSSFNANGLTAAWSNDVLTLTLSGLRESDINLSGGKSLSSPTLLTGVPEEVDSQITGFSELVFDLTNGVAADLSTFAVTVDGTAIGPIDVSTATTGTELAAILTTHSDFVTAGLTAVWIGDLLTVTHPNGAVALSAPSLLTGTSSEVDSDINIVSGAVSRVELQITDTLAAELSTFSLGVDSTPAGPVDVSSALTGTDLADLLNADTSFAGLELTAVWSADVLTISHSEMATLSDLTLFNGAEETVAVTADVFKGFSSRVELNIAETDQGGLALQFPIRKGLSTFAIAVGGTQFEVDVSASTSGTDLAGILNADSDLTDAGLTDLSKEQKIEVEQVPMQLIQEVVAVLLKHGFRAKLLETDNMDPLTLEHLRHCELDAGCDLLGLGIWGDGAPTQWDRNETIDVISLS